MEGNEDDLSPLVDEDLLQEILLAVVRHPEELRIEVTGVVGQGKVLTVHCHPEDRGRVVGKHGTCVNGIRQLFRTIGAYEGRHILVEVDEPGRQRAADRHLRSVRGGRR